MKRRTKNLRKLFLLFVGISILVSCSVNSEESQAFSGENSQDVRQTMMKDAKDNVDPVLEGLYSTMIKSDSYIKFIDASKAFSDKIGDDMPDSVVFGSAMLNWISGNISKTKFKDFNEANSEYNNLLFLSANDTNKNMGFYNYLGGTTPGKFLPIFTSPQPITLKCPNCTKQYNACTGAADEAYTGSVESASTNFVKGNISNYDFDMEKAGARNDWDRAYKKCTTTYNICCSGN